MNHIAITPESCCSPGDSCIPIDLTMRDHKNSLHCHPLKVLIVSLDKIFYLPDHFIGDHMSVEILGDKFSSLFSHFSTSLGRFSKSV